MKHANTLVALPALAFASCAMGSYRYEAPRDAGIDATGAEVLEVDARAGSLTIEGKSGLSTVDVTGTAGAAKEDVLERIQIRIERSERRILVAADIPQNETARLDLVIHVPPHFAAEISDSSGDVVLRNLASVQLDDSSGDVDISDIAGEVTIDDSSGDIRVARVGGKVRVDDNSGDISIDVAGPVWLTDSSGDVHVANVTGDVTVASDSSGDITAKAVSGNFRVEEDGSGDIHHDGVAGDVSLPD